MEAETIEDDIGEEGFTKKQIEEVKQKLWIENSTRRRKKIRTVLSVLVGNIVGLGAYILPESQSYKEALCTIVQRYDIRSRCDESVC